MANALLDPVISQLTSQISALQARITQLERNQRSAYNLANSSIEADNLIVNDANGNAAVVVGLQSDGTYGIAGVGEAVPTTAPDAPQVMPAINSLMAVWDGLMAGGQPPMNFASVQVHCSTQPVFVPSSATLQGSIPGPGLFTVPNLTAGTTYYIALVGVNQQGNTGPASVIVPGVPVSVASGIAPGSISAGQVNFTASAIGGPMVSVGPSQPSNPNNGDLWFNANAGYTLEQYESGTWSPYQFGTSAIQAGSITAALIAANCITSDQIAAGSIVTNSIAANAITTAQLAAGAVTAANIAAGTIVARIVDGTTITGATFVATGTQGEFLAYTGTPGAGNLFCSISGAAGNDSYGNAYDIGVGVYYGTSNMNILVDPYNLCPAIHMLTGLGTESGYASMYNLPVNPGGVAEFENLWIQGPASTYDNSSCSLVLASTSKNGASTYAGIFNAYSAGVETQVAYWIANGIHINQSLYGTGGVLSIPDEIATSSGSGPFVNGETWHTISMPSGFTGALSGGIGMKVMLLPWNAVFIVMCVNLGSNTGGTYTFGNLPSSAYSPAQTLWLPVGTNFSVAGNHRLYISGTGVQLITATGGSTGAAFATSLVYPTN